MKSGDSKGFGHVALIPKDEGSIRKCMTLYNNTVWKSKKLRIEIAKEDFKQRLKILRSIDQDIQKFFQKMFF